MRFYQRLIVTIASFALLLFHKTYAQTTFTTTSGGNWTTASWTCKDASNNPITCPTTYPSLATHNVVIQNTGVVLNVNTTVGNVTLSAGRLEGDWSSGRILNVSNNFTINTGYSSGSSLNMGGMNLAVGNDFSVTDGSNTYEDVALTGASTFTIGRDLLMTSTNNVARAVQIQANGTCAISVGRNVVYSSATGTADEKRDQNYLQFTTSSSFTLGGNITSPANGYYDFSNGSTFKLNGSVAQSIPTLKNSWQYFGRLVINNTSGSDVTITPTSYNNGVTVNIINIDNSLTLTSGTFKTGQTSIPACGTTTNLNFSRNATGVTATNGLLSGAFSKTGTSFTATLGNSSIAINGASADANTTYPDADSWANETGLASQTVYRMIYNASDPGNKFAVAGGIHHVSSYESFDVATCGATPTSTNMSFGWSDACASQIDDVSTSPQTLYMARWNSGTSKWDNLSGTINGGSEACVTADGDKEAGSIAVTGISTFGRFTFASSSATLNPLPIILKNFSGKEVQEGIQLTWETTTELNTRVFEIERSVDGINFEMIGTMDAKGNSETDQHYSFLDGQHVIGRNYYRLKQIDLDNVFTYSSVIVVIASHEQNLKFYPNPVTANGKVTMNQKVGFMILNNIGNTVRSYTVTNEIETADLLPGLYFIKTDSDCYKLIIK